MADVAPGSSVGLCSSSGPRQSAASVMAQPHEANRQVQSNRTPGCPRGENTAENSMHLTCCTKFGSGSLGEDRMQPQAVDLGQVVSLGSLVMSLVGSLGWKAWTRSRATPLPWSGAMRGVASARDPCGGSLVLLCGAQRQAHELVYDNARTSTRSGSPDLSHPPSTADPSARANPSNSNRHNLWPSALS